MRCICVVCGVMACAWWGQAVVGCTLDSSTVVHHMECAIAICGKVVHYI
jgi:hypothetical protein